MRIPPSERPFPPRSSHFPLRPPRYLRPWSPSHASVTFYLNCSQSSLREYRARGWTRGPAARPRGHISRNELKNSCGECGDSGECFYFCREDRYNRTMKHAWSFRVVAWEFTVAGEWPPGGKGPSPQMAGSHSREARMKIPGMMEDPRAERESQFRLCGIAHGVAVASNPTKSDYFRINRERRMPRKSPPRRTPNHAKSR